MQETWLRKKEMHRQTGMPMTVIERICHGNYKDLLTLRITPEASNSPVLIWKEKSLKLWKEGKV